MCVCVCEVIYKISVYVYDYVLYTFSQLDSNDVKRAISNENKPIRKIYIIPNIFYISYISYLMANELVRTFCTSCGANELTPSILASTIHSASAFSIKYTLK